MRRMKADIFPVPIVALDRIPFFTADITKVVEFEHGLKTGKRQVGIRKIRPALEGVERLKPLDRVALSAGSDGVANYTQQVHHGLPRGSGLRYIPVSHVGNHNCSPEEADVVAELVQGIVDARATWTKKDGNERPIGMNEILIITPYNAQVYEIQQRLPGERIGTVDKFQGQEAPIAIYSLATSSHADAPRGMEFLYSLNRLNVATSRARCLSYLVCSPAVFEAECRDPRQMQLASAFCRFLEMAA